MISNWFKISKSQIKFTGFFGEPLFAAKDVSGNPRVHVGGLGNLYAEDCELEPRYFDLNSNNIYDDRVQWYPFFCLSIYIKVSSYVDWIRHILIW